MDTDQLKENFKNQLKEVDAKIQNLENDLNTAKEYKLKLIGGLETLELLSKDPEEIPAPEVDVTEIEDK